MVYVGFLMFWETALRKFTLQGHGAEGNFGSIRNTCSAAVVCLQSEGPGIRPKL